MPILKVKKSDIYILLVLFIVIVSFFIYTKGAFAYPWLEDDDPWNHATSIKYVAVEKNLSPPEKSFQYLKPYPPGYAAVLGLLHQTSDSIYWTMKFFNSLIISIGFMFFFLFVKHFLHNQKKAIIATFILASIPSYLSHFIWAHSLIVTMLFPALYAVEFLKTDRRWSIISILIIASIALTQPTQPIKLLIIFGIYFLVRCISARKLDFTLLAALFGGYLLSLIWWWNNWKPMFIMSAQGTFSQLLGAIMNAFSPTSGTATRAYTFNEIVFAKLSNMINNPIGIGVMLSILIIVGLIAFILNYKKLLSKEYDYMWITLLSSIYTFLGFNVITFNLPIGLIGFRFWMLFAVFASILATEGIWLVFKVFSKSFARYLVLIFSLEILFIFYKLLPDIWNAKLMYTAFGQ